MWIGRAHGARLSGEPAQHRADNARTPPPGGGGWQNRAGHARERWAHAAPPPLPARPAAPGSGPRRGGPPAPDPTLSCEDLLNLLLLFHPLLFHLLLFHLLLFNLLLFNLLLFNLLPDIPDIPRTFGLHVSHVSLRLGPSASRT